MEKMFKIGENEYSLKNKIGFDEDKASYLVTNEGEDYLLEEYLDSELLEMYVENTCDLVASQIPMLNLIELDAYQKMLVKEYKEGKSLYYMILDGEDISNYIEQIKVMAEEMKKEDLALDFFPTNFIVVDNKVYYTSFEIFELDENTSLENNMKFFSKTKEFDDYVKHHSR